MMSSVHLGIILYETATAQLYLKYAEKKETLLNKTEVFHTRERRCPSHFNSQKEHIHQEKRVEWT